MDVVLKGVGVNDNIEQQVDPSRNAARVAIQPTEWLVGGVQGGHYNLCATTGAVAGAVTAAAQVFSVRWNDPSKKMLLERVSVSGVCAAFSSGVGADLQLVLAHSFTANAGASNKTAIVPSTTSQMSRLSTMAASSFNAYGEIAVCTTAALTAGTQTLDTAGVGAAQLQAGAVGYGSGLVDLWNRVAYGQHPIVIENNQGFVVSTPTGWASSNSWRISVNMSWIEIAAY
jgi:hypothetical protein